VLRAGETKVTITIDQVRDVLMGWDIDVNVQAAAGEKISSIDIRINDSPVAQDSPSDPLDSWAIHLSQKGVYPGDNRVDVVVTDPTGNKTRARKKW
jgi:hypothetical protein